MDVFEKLKILTDAAKYDAACTSSGADRSGSGSLGSAVGCGICHSFAADGRCISLLKVLFSNACVYDCKYCVNRRTNSTPRATFTPRELAELTIAFYRRNYIEGLFLSSGVLRDPNYTTENLIRTLELLRGEYGFGGYIHAKAIPGTDPVLLRRLGLLADRMSVNIELPSQQSLRLLAPDKSKTDILAPMRLIRDACAQNEPVPVRARGEKPFAPAGQSTQMIIGASPETDLSILRLTQSLYRTYRLKRVFFSAYTPVTEDSLLPSPETRPPLLREHRLYQADWLLRYYGFDAEELLDEASPSLHPLLDPKCGWALRHPERFPVEINRAPLETLLRVPGIGPTGARRVLVARRHGLLRTEDLPKLGVVMKRARYFITCAGKADSALAAVQRGDIPAALLSSQGTNRAAEATQLTFFTPEQILEQEVRTCLPLRI